MEKQPLERKKCKCQQLLLWLVGQGRLITLTLQRWVALVAETDLSIVSLLIVIF